MKTSGQRKGRKEIEKMPAGQQASLEQSHNKSRLTFKSTQLFVPCYGSVIQDTAFRLMCIEILNVHLALCPLDYCNSITIFLS